MIFFYSMQESKADGGIPTFKSTHPKWSFVRIDEKNNVVEVQEKNPISNMATVGFYYFKKGKDFVKNAEEMIKADDRVNNEFYLCPVYNYLIKNGGVVKTSKIKEMWGLGTPEDLDSFLKLTPFHFMQKASTSFLKALYSGPKFKSIFVLSFCYFQFGSLFSKNALIPS